MKVFQGLYLTLAVLFLAACGPNESAIPSAATTSAYFLSQDAQLEIDGLKIRYRDEGPRGASAIIMVHGFASSLETWDSLAAELSNDYRVIRLDLPGHGLTGPDPESRYTNEETVEFLGKFVTALDIKKPLLIGNSSGGLVSWRLAAKSPEAVSGLVLIAPGGFSINGVTETPVEVPMMVKFYLTKAPMAGVKQATGALYGDPEKLSEARINSVHDMMVWPGNGDAFVARAASFTLPDPTEDLQGIEVPTLIIWGDKDVMVPAAHAEKFAAAMPKVTLKLYENAGHVPQEETPEQLASDVREFFASLENQ